MAGRRGGGGGEKNKHKNGCQVGGADGLADKRRETALVSLTRPVWLAVSRETSAVVTAGRRMRKSGGRRERDTQPAGPGRCGADEWRLLAGLLASGAGELRGAEE